MQNHKVSESVVLRRPQEQNSFRFTHTVHIADKVEEEDRPGYNSSNSTDILCGFIQLVQQSRERLRTHGGFVEISPHQLTLL